LLRSAEVKPLFYRFVQLLLDFFSFLTVHFLKGRSFHLGAAQDGLSGGSKLTKSTLVLKPYFAFSLIATVCHDY
jgi:hypothetical protein